MIANEYWIIQSNFSEEPLPDSPTGQLLLVDIKIYIGFFLTIPIDLTDLFHSNQGDVEGIEKLIKNGVDVNEKYDGATALHFASKFGKFISNQDSP